MPLYFQRFIKSCLCDSVAAKLVNLVDTHYCCVDCRVKHQKHCQSCFHWKLLKLCWSPLVLTLKFSLRSRLVWILYNEETFWRYGTGFWNINSKQSIIDIEVKPGSSLSSARFQLWSTIFMEHYYQLFYFGLIKKFCVLSCHFRPSLTLRLQIFALITSEVGFSPWLLSVTLNPFHANTTAACTVLQW